MNIKDLKENSYKLASLYGFKELTKVEEETIIQSRKDKDIVVIGDTGTGKTYAFLLAIAEKIDPDNPHTQFIISVPTRELAKQIYDVVTKFKTIFPNIRIKLLTGGRDRTKETMLINNEPHIIISTPGRIHACFKDNLIRLDQIKMFIIDEADMTLEYGFLEDIDVIFSRMNEKVEVLCFSATFPEGLKPFAKKYLRNPAIIKIEDKEIFKPKIENILIDAKHLDYGQALLKILPGFEPYICLIFANSKVECDAVYEILKSHGYKALLWHGGLSTRERQRALKALKRDEYRYVVASDVAARGIDIDGISHVVSLGLPNDLSFYFHRSGRTGRAGREGICFTIYKEKDEQAINILKKKGVNFIYKNFKNGEWKETKNIPNRRKKNIITIDGQTAKILNANKKIKPNYRKKKREAINKLERRQRRDFIKNKIKEEKKQLYRRK